VAEPRDFCPYVGLQPFRAKDRDYFFGREREQRVISANLFAAPLTVLYGPSAVGKSSVLQAGVISHLANEPRTAVVYFATWQGEAYLAELKAECRKTIEAALRGPLKVDDNLPLDDWIAEALKQFPGTLLLMFDQFEEYLLYHREEDSHAFDAELARIINRSEVGANVLIGLRDDSLSKLNRFSKRIPNLLGNTLQLRRLTPEAARRAITGPIEKYTAQFPNERPTRIEPSLVAEVIEDVKIGRIIPSVSGGIGGVQASEDVGLIETAFLQLVLTELWREASAKPGDRVLDSNTLKTLGGADAIVRRHVDRELGKLDENGQAIAAKLFQHLVTPSGAKYALNTDDLVDLAERPREQVLPVLKALADARLLRRIESSNRYEIFHDAFAEALLEWRKEYLLKCAQQEALRVAEAKRQAEERARIARLRRLALVGIGLFFLLGVAGYLFEQQRDKQALARRNDELLLRMQISEARAKKADLADEAVKNATAYAEQAKRAAESDRLAADSRAEFEIAQARGQVTATRLAALQEAARKAIDDKSRADAEARRLEVQTQVSVEAVKASQTRIEELTKQAAQKGIDVASDDTKAAAIDKGPTTAATDVPRQADREGVQAVINQYKSAFESLNAGALRAIWPSAPQSIESSFGQMRSYSLEINGCQFSFPTDTRASATCAIHQTAVTKRGDRRVVTDLKPTFELTKSAGKWTITDVR
jgi:Tfp pilus assembly protein PilV